MLWVSYISVVVLVGWCRTILPTGHNNSYYIGSGVNFLRHYGNTFNLFDIFHSPRFPVNSKIINSTVSSEFNFLQRNYSQYFGWENIPLVGTSSFRYEYEGSYYPLMNKSTGLFEALQYSNFAVT